MIVTLSRLALAAGMVVSLSAPGSIRAPGTPKQAKPKMVSTAAAKGRGAGGAADENIKKPMAANATDAKIPAPASKGGTATRGAACIVHVDNRTSLYINFYFDGEYRGNVGPWGDGYGYVGCGSTRLYARADFTDGSYSSWGPIVADVDGTFTWRVHP